MRDLKMSTLAPCLGIPTFVLISQYLTDKTTNKINFGSSKSFIYMYIYFTTSPPYTAPTTWSYKWTCTEILFMCSDGRNPIKQTGKEILVLPTAATLLSHVSLWTSHSHWGTRLYVAKNILRLWCLLDFSNLSVFLSPCFRALHLTPTDWNHCCPYRKRGMLNKNTKWAMF